MKKRSDLLIAMSFTPLLGMFGCADTATDDVANNEPPPPPPVVVVEPATPDTSVDPPPVAPVEEVAAEVGFGEKGHYESQDYISVAVGSQFRVEEQLTLSLIANAMRQHKALHGHFPKTDKDFFESIIEANSINLPELPPGQKYGYDPELAEESKGEDSLTILKPK